MSVACPHCKPALPAVWLIGKLVDLPRAPLCTACCRTPQSGALGPQYDGGRVALWGTSFAGGHVLVTAADLAAEGAAANVSCVVSMVGGHAA